MKKEKNVFCSVKMRNAKCKRNFQTVSQRLHFLFQGRSVRINSGFKDVQCV